MSSKIDAPVEATTLKLVGIRVAKKGESKVKATITLDKDLIDSFTFQATFTKSSASTVFDGVGRRMKTGECMAY